ncbi:MAG: ytvI, partial [Bacilli bacterium]|nr:ytvI [Bacilli bacterium]
MKDHNPFQARRDELRTYGFRVLEVLLLLIFLSLLAWLFMKTLDYTLPFVLGLVLAIFLNPVVRWLEKLRVGRLPAVLIAMIGTLGIIIGLVSYGMVIIVQET